jgi:hypothetical protein
MTFRNVVQVVCILALLSASAFAQVDVGAITGTVTDATSAVVPGAKVVITHEETSVALALITNESGFYAATALRSGKYHIAVSNPGFRTETRSGIEVRIQERLKIDFKLELGVAAAEITVSAAPLLLESETSSLGQVIERITITELPLSGRNFIQLATLGAGTLPSTRTAERDNFVSNGARPIQNSYLLDGIENKNRIMGFDKSSGQIIQPVIDAIQEFKVQTSTFSAEFGQAAGGVVNVTLRSGTNSIHGSAFEFLRNSYMDARPYFQPAAGGNPQFIQNQFGATLGGPVLKDRTFFFGSWQSSRESNAAPQIASVPTPEFRQGDFGTAKLFDPGTTRPNPAGSGFIRDPFPGSKVPSTRWDPVATKLAALYPLPNLPGNVRNHFYNPKERISNNQFNIRVDHRLGDKDNLFGRVSTSSNENTLPAPMPQPANDLSIAYPTSQSVAVSETHTLTNAIVNEFRFGYIHTLLKQNSVAPRRFEEFGIKGALDDPNIRGLPQFGISGLSTLGTTAPGDLPIAATGSGNLPLEKWGRVFQFLDNLSWVRNRHTVKFGADVQQVSIFVSATNAARPNINFNGVYTQNPQSRAGTGNAYADFLLGLSNSSTIATRSINTIRQRIFQGYIQDDWKVTSKLTLNFGLRYELTKPFVEVDDIQSNFITDAGPYYGTILLASDRKDSGLGRALVGTDYNNFAPRFGFAYQLTPKTVLRGGSGVFYGRDENIGVQRRLTNNPPFFVNKQFISDQVTPNIVLSVGFPPNSLDPKTAVNPTVNTYPRESPLPYVLQWNINLQRELPGQIVAQLGYTGSGGHKFYFPNNLNTPLPGPGAIDPRRPFLGYGSVMLYGPLINSTYNALLAKVERRFSKGFNLLASYTWGHSIDSGRSQNDNQDPGPQNPRDLRANRGNSNFDVTHRFVVSKVYKLPFGKGKFFSSRSTVVNAIVGGWQLSGITSMQTGQPFSVTLNFDPTNTGATAFPDRIRNGALPASERDPARWFDLAAFVAPPQYTFGNSGRSILRGPGRVNVDLSLARNFQVRERLQIQFRGEAFNLANTPQFDIPAFSIGAPGAGIIGGVITPERQIQFGLKLTF